MRLLAAVLLACLAAAALAGCAVDQQEDVARYRSLLDLGQLPEVPAGDAPLTLPQALALANENDERLAIAGENYVQALIARQRAVASFLPTVNLVPTYIYRERSSSGIEFLDDPTQLDVPVSGQLNVFRGLRDLAALKGSEETIEQQRALLLDARESLLLDVAGIFYQVLRSERSVAVLENSLASQEERVRDMQARQLAGMARPLDVAQTESQASQTRLELIDSQNDVARARSTLSFLIGAPLARTPLADEYDVPEAPPPERELQARAAANRHDLIAAAAAERAARQGVESAIGEYYPTVSIDFAYFLDRDSLPTDRTWEGILSANLPIFSGGRIEADVRTAWSQLRQAALFESETRRRVREEIEHALQDFDASTRRLAEVKTKLAAASEASAQAEETYNVGLSTNLERLTAQDQLLTAQLGLASEQFDHKFFYLVLLRTTGEMAQAFTGDVGADR